MNESSVLKFSFLLFLIFFSITILYFNTLAEPIANITSRSVGKFLCVKGNFSIEKIGKGFLIGKLNDKTGEIKVFLYNTSDYFSFLKSKDFQENIKICGKIKYYKGEIEIIPSKIYV